MKKPGKNANYDYARQKEPQRPMGQGSFANMPEHPIMEAYGPPQDYRDGIVNSFTCNISRVSKIDENER
jgi:hypothetical protein